MKIHCNFQPFASRNERAQFIASHFRIPLNESTSVLDVGCSENDLKNILGGKVFGIDISGVPDRIVNLEKESLSMFTDDQFDMSVCTEVLEHIDNLYEVIDDLVRVSKKYVLISLPNCPDIWKLLTIIRTGTTGKFYGLPLEKPGDRHKWFFSLGDLEKFFDAYCQKNKLKNIHSFAHFNYGHTLKGRLLKFFLRILPWEVFSSSYWILIKK